MKKLWMKLTLVTGVTAVGIVASAAMAARPIGPDCGPTRLWVCINRDGTEFDFAGTICEKTQLERRTGASCRPSPF